MVEDLVNIEVIMDSFVDDYDTDLFVQSVPEEPMFPADTMDMLAYVSDSFDRHGPWKYSDSSCTEIKMNVASTRNIEQLREGLKHTLSEAYRAMGKGNDPDSCKASDFLNIYLNRDFYLMMQDFINERESDTENDVEMVELLEVQKVWILMQMYRTSASSLFHKPEMYAPVRKIKLDYERYKSIMTTLGAAFPNLDVFEASAECEKAAAESWGKFNQYNTVLMDLESFVGRVGRKFLADDMDLTIDDDKLRHSSRKFRDEGLQMSGFRGSRIGPVMNGLGNTQMGLIYSIHFSRHGDGADTVCKNLFKSVGYGSDSTLKNHLSGLVLIDRGYNLPTVVQRLLDMHLNYLGTHSEKVSQWPFWSGDVVKKPKATLAISSSGARAAFTAERSIGRRNGLKQYAIVYRNGKKGIGNISTSVPTHCKQWDYRVARGESISVPPRIPCDIGNTVHESWMNNVYIITANQAVSPWFECRMGHLTGTTAKNVLRCIKFVLLQHVLEVDVLLGMLGFNLDKPTKETLQNKTPLALKKACKTLGYENALTKDQAIQLLLDQFPHDSLVFMKIIKSWCMAPIKSKGQEPIEQFRQGVLAEPLIHNALPQTISKGTDGILLVESLFQVGFVQNNHDKICGVSPDSMSILSCAQLQLTTESQNLNDIAAPDLSKLLNFIESGQMKHCKHNIGTSRHHFVCAHEYKHKGSAMTVAKCVEIRANVLSGSMLSILNLSMAADRCQFRKAIPNVDYRCQVTHEAYACDVSCVLFVVASTKIEYMVLVLFPASILDVYSDCMLYTKNRYLWYLFKEDGSHDTHLINLPSFNNKLNWGYAVDRNTLKCRLQIMMHLLHLRAETGKPLPNAVNIIPSTISLWNTLKGAIDDLSKVLAHTLAKWGPISPIVVIWIRVWCTCLYNAWRLYGLHKTKSYILSDKCKSQQHFLDARQRHGGTWENFLALSYKTIELPRHVIRAPSTSRRSRSIPNTPTPPEDRPIFNQRTTRRQWNENESLVSFRMNGNTKDHIVADIRHIAAMVGSKRKADNCSPIRRLCKYCCTTIPQDNARPKKVSIFHKTSPSAPTKACIACQVPLCMTSPSSTGVHAGKSCFERFHTVRNLPQYAPP